jgi:hypothetical protein
VRIISNLIGPYVLLTSLFLIIIPLATFVRYYDNAEISKILIILIANIISLFIFIVFPKLKVQDKIQNLDYSALRLVILSGFCLLPLVVFVVNSVQGFSLSEIAIFSGAYRQGNYSGSGIYTAWSTQILPLIIFLILITNGPSKTLVIPVLVVVIASLILGLRIYLWGIFIGFFLTMVKNLNIRKILFGLTIVLLLFSYKFFLNPEAEIVAYELFLNQLTRPDLHAIVKYSIFSDNIIDLFEYFPYVRFLFGHDLTAFKEFYVPSIQNLNLLMPFISLYSGVALPGYVMIYNSLFLMAIIPSVLILLTNYNLIILMTKAKRLFLKILFAYLFIVLSLAFLEDVNVLYKLEEELVFVVLTYICFLFIAVKKVN